MILANVQFRGQDRDARLRGAWEDLLHHVSAIPGVETASLSSGSVFDGAYGNGMLRFPGIPTDIRNPAGCIFFRVSPNFFRTMGTPLLDGRDFAPHDFEASAPHVALVSESLVRHFFGDANPIGRTFSNFEDNPPKWITVIGVVKDTKFRSLRAASPLAVYLPYTWPRPGPVMSLALRARSDMAPLGAALHREASAANPEFAIRRITTQSKLIDDTLVRERLLATVGSFFGVLALLMAGIGLFGITSYTVAQRTQEIDIRMALGAT